MAPAAKKTKKKSTARTTKKATPKTASKAKGTQKSAAKATSTAKSPAKAKPGKPIRIDYLIEKLDAENGPISELPETAETLDLVILSHLGIQMSLPDARKAITNLRTQFVDWNEVRVSPLGEVRDALKGADDPVDLAQQIQEFLNRLFLEFHHVGLEFLREKSNPEIKSFFKKSPWFSDATVSLVLERVNEYPVVPLENFAQPFLERVGLGTPDSTPLQRQKDLYEKITRDQVSAVQLLVHDHARRVCPPDELDLDCPGCVLKRGCPYPAKVTPRQRATAKKVKRAK